MKSKILDEISLRNMNNSKCADFKVGDTVKVSVRIREGGKDRLQAYSGTVIARKGSGGNETFTVRRMSFGEGMERIFFVHSPAVAKIEVERSGKVRRAKIYYLRKLSGKETRLKGQST